MSSSEDWITKTLKEVGIDSESNSTTNNVETVKMFRGFADMIEKEGCAVLGAGVAIFFEDGNVGTCYTGTHFTSLLGAVSLLRKRIEENFNEPNH